VNIEFLSSANQKPQHPPSASRGDHLQDTKDVSGIDWYVEGPGRRVGYEDRTAIDWIFEYAKERQQLRYLYAGLTGILGHMKQLADASHV
jgi:chloride channel 3/4/5